MEASGLIEKEMGRREGRFLKNMLSHHPKGKKKFDNLLSKVFYL